ncbi:CidA/LrgA family protein [Candidatus Sodalis endolongispinus]|uniref:CidA/LrgA family protein n=1 Tax=Candidatus Sodalis endolongispinus TaxID=2812662 RepID=A0ABS5Y8E9_9GAMM|nr:CidA/LrgA family protein [Candidatus Sodalis endolongispinus]MBT9431258.1 CidA/LrgA family protein [Candidatus Sodalis endolongispinus]
MRKIVTNAWAFVRAFILIYLCLYAGIFFSALLPFAIPGSIIGMLLLFVLLSFQLVPTLWLKPGCYLLIRYMALLFVPIGVGVMNYYQQLGPIVISCAVSTVMVMVVVGLSSHYDVHREWPIAGQPQDAGDR